LGSWFIVLPLNGLAAIGRFSEEVVSGVGEFGTFRMEGGFHVFRHLAPDAPNGMTVTRKRELVLSMFAVDFQC
jgi:hypothetical protein